MIKHYYQEEGITIYNADCLLVLPQLDKVDLVLTDPPYGIDFCSSWTSRKERIKNDKLDDWLNLMKEWLPLVRNILTSTGCCCCCCGGGGKTPVTAILTMEIIKHFSLIQTLVWKKFIGLGWKYRPAYENIIVFSKDGRNYNFYDTSKKCSNVIEGINQDIPQYRADEPGNYNEHPTQKPVALMKHLLNIHSKQNYVVLDSFLGGGSSLVACKELGRRGIGIEISEEYCEIAVKRLKNTQRDLFL